MKVLWICNILLPALAEKLGRETSHKEGWLSGILRSILDETGTEDKEEITLGVAFPVQSRREESRCEVQLQGRRILCYSFYEETHAAQVYTPGLEERMGEILKDFQADVIHCFGTEYGHTLAAARACGQGERLLISIQGLCAVYADAYMADLPERVIRSATLRDLLKRDSLKRQQEKFRLRGEHEMEALSLAGNVAGRTDWDRSYTEKWNPKARYHVLNETLRPSFYKEKWRAERAEEYSVFISQGDYPIKGLHYMLMALPALIERFPRIHVYVAGDDVVSGGSLTRRLKRSAYSRYLVRLMDTYGLWEHVTFLGRLDERAMLRQYLSSSLFVCCSAIENSPNSLGEAMILGMPCVSADVGGIPSLFRDGEDGILYRGFRKEKESLREQASALTEAVTRMWTEPEKQEEYGENAARHAARTHDPRQNYKAMKEIYTSIRDACRYEKKVDSL